jgi:oxygen-independent coproporphyrinogen-3 oxidase
LRHIYVHVPFCRRRCSYCDFSIAVRRAIPAHAYLDAIRRERDLLLATGDWDEAPLETLYLGGGTPSLLPAAVVRDLVRLFGVSPQSDTGRPASEIEVTLEANPDDVTPEAVAGWCAAGVNRVSLGVQSFHDAVLAWMHRTHDAGRAEAAFGTLRDAGIANISLDLIFALPGALRSDFRADLDRALALGPDHLSVYGLSVEPRTPLARWLARGALAPTPERRYGDEFLQAHEVLAAAGFEHYEVSNYARPGRRSRHNAAYWTRHPYAGLGPSAHSFGDGVRRWNLPAWAAYARALSSGKRPEAERERLTSEQQRIEGLYLGLRTSAGIEHAALRAAGRAVAEHAVRQGWLVAEGDRLRASAAGWLRLDEIVARLTT